MNEPYLEALIAKNKKQISKREASKRITLNLLDQVISNICIYFLFKINYLIKMTVVRKNSILTRIEQ